MTDYLIVDDEFPIREWVVFVIKKHFPDIHVDSADNGLTALSMLHKKHYDFLITDIRMPKLNGMELLQKLHDVSPSTKIVVLSSYSDYNYVRHAFKHYALDYLLKAEITEDHLVQIIRQQQRLILNQENTRNVTRIVSDHIMNPALSLESFELQLKNNGVELPLSDFFLYFIKSDGVTFEYGSAKIPSGKYAEPVLSIPVSPNCQLGIIHLTQISRRVQFQDRNTFFTELAQYNSHSLILSSDICRNKADILRFLRIMYIHRDLDFYGIRKHLITEESFLWESAFNLAYGNLLRTIQFRDPENFSDTLQ